MTIGAHHFAPRNVETPDTQSAKHMIARPTTETLAGIAITAMTIASPPITFAISISNLFVAPMSGSFVYVTDKIRLFPINGIPVIVLGIFCITLFEGDEMAFF